LPAPQRTIDEINRQLKAADLAQRASAAAGAGAQV
jgi:hypothetical protein